MAKKGNRVQVILECTEHKSGVQALLIHYHQKQEKYTWQNWIKKYNPILKKYTLHKEIK